MVESTRETTLVRRRDLADHQRARVPDFGRKPQPVGLSAAGGMRLASFVARHRRARRRNAGGFKADSDVAHLAGRSAAM
jgi:hypothetical protein